MSTDQQVLLVGLEHDMRDDHGRDGDAGLQVVKSTFVILPQNYILIQIDFNLNGWL
jgi:hypothetical protein